MKKKINDETNKIINGKGIFPVPRGIGRDMIIKINDLRKHLAKAAILEPHCDDTEIVDLLEENGFEVFIYTSDLIVYNWFISLGYKNVKRIEGISGMKLDNKFDVIIANPPYQESTANKHFSSKQSGQNKIWVKFVEKALELLSDDGVMGFITPNNWTYQTNTLFSTLKDRIVFANLDTKAIKKKYFKGVGSSFTWYVATKNPNDLVKEYQLEDGVSINENILDECILPTKDVDPVSFSIFRKLCSVSDAPKQWIRKQFGKTVYTKTPTHIYRNLVSSSKESWSDEQDPCADKPKVVLYRSSSRLAYYDSENSASGNIYAYYAKSELEAKKIVDLLNTKFYQFVLKNIKSGMALVSTINKIPLVIKNEINTTEDLYKYFKLSEEEINYIETTIK